MVKVIPLNRAEHDNLYKSMNKETFLNISRWRADRKGAYVISSDNIETEDVYTGLNLTEKLEGDDEKTSNVVPFKQGPSCIVCGDKIPPVEAESCYTESAGAYICHDCATLDYIQQYMA